MPYPRAALSLHCRGDIVVTPPIGFEENEVDWIFFADGTPAADGKIQRSTEHPNGFIPPFNANEPIAPHASIFWIRVYDAQGRVMRQFTLTPGNGPSCRMMKFDSL